MPDPPDHRRRARAAARAEEDRVRPGPLGRPGRPHRGRARSRPRRPPARWPRSRRWLVSPDALEHMASIEFRFPYRPSWDQTAEVYMTSLLPGRGGRVRRDRAALVRRGRAAVGQMWDDARYWLPRVLAGQHVAVTITFAEDCATVAAIEPVSCRSPGARSPVPAVAAAAGSCWCSCDGSVNISMSSYLASRSNALHGSRGRPVRRASPPSTTRPGRRRRPSWPRCSCSGRAGRARRGRRGRGHRAVGRASGSAAPGGSPRWSRATRMRAVALTRLGLNPGPGRGAGLRGRPAGRPAGPGGRRADRGSRWWPGAPRRPGCRTPAPTS